MRILAAYDGSLHSRAALTYGLKKVKETGARLIALHVFHRAMFIDYDALPGAEDAARSDALRHAGEAERIIREAGEDLRAKVIIAEGIPEEEIIKHAVEENISVIVCPPRYASIVKKAPCPVSVVPDCIAAPRDKIRNFMAVSSRH
jgi:nucleotide-binding universal stress UspA family protein